MHASIYLVLDWMRFLRAVTAVGAAALMVGSAGCFRTTRLVNRTTAPDVYRSAPVEVLEREVSERDAKIKTLNASVLVTAKTGGGKTGKETTYTSVKGYIFLRRPRNLRVLLQAPVLGSAALDMVSNGETFTLMYATLGHGDKWVTGPNQVTTKSANGLENLRPPVFFDALLVPPVGEKQLVTLTESTRLLPSPDKKRTEIEEPDYDLTVSEIKSGNVLRTVRVVHISRVTMLPFQQDTYDEKGEIVTRTMYDKYQTINGVDFPSVVNIIRPIDQYELKVQITKLTLNEDLPDDQFKLDIPAGVTVQALK